MKKYLEHMHAQPAHYRRQHAAKIATVVTAVIFVGWLGSLGVRVGTNNYGTSNSSKESQLANAISGLGTQSSSNVLEVSTTTTYTGQ